MRANRMKVLVHDGIGFWLAARRLHQGHFVWPAQDGQTQLSLSRAQLDALVLGLPWSRIGEGVTPLPSAANMRSAQTVRSTHTHWLGADSVCLAFSDTGTDSLMRSHFLNVAFPLIRTPFPHAAFLLRTSQATACQCLGTRGEHRLSRLSSAHLLQRVFGLAQLLQPIGTTMVLTPASRHLGRQVSPLFSLHLPNVPPPTTPCNPNIALHAIFQRTGRVSDFAMRLQARRHTPPNRVRYPADRQFASGCSPPRLAATQLPSTTGPWLTLTRTFTVLT
ncbi:MAG: IS66 family insertion sequence element accessory protein TnpB [Comamonadaceae bacterium]|nr:IS66 family insertion sequence element accessory protein TnpB [Comamonadaceae bacterium]